jgi:bile acid:Na+ symporter, BASS family
VTAILILLLKLSVVLTIVAVGAGAVPASVIWLWRRPRLLVRSLAAMYLLVPLFAFALVQLFPISQGVKAAMLVLAVSSGAPLLPKKLKVLSSREYIFSLLVTSSIVAIVAVPLWTALLTAYYGVSVDLSFGTVTLAIAKAILLPIAAGMLLHALFPAWSERLSDPVIRVASLVLAVAGVLLVAIEWRLLLEVGWQGVLALAALLIFALIVGDLLGGPDTDDRKALAIACATRHVGVAVVVATQFVGVRTAVLIVAYFLTAIVISNVYLRWRH